MDGILNIHVKRNDRNNAANDAPSVMHHELLKLRRKEFDQILQHSNRLSQFWNSDGIDKIDQDHTDLLKAYPV